MGPTSDLVMATLTYNGITLPYVNITQFEQSAMYDQLGQTDWYVTRFDITAQTVLNSNYFTLRLGGANTPPVTNPADIMDTIRTMLLRPRKTLSITFNGVELIPKAQSGLPGTVDAQNGPKPISCAIIPLTDVTFLIIYRITGNYWENNKLSFITSSSVVTNQQGSDVLYVRWTDSVEIDQNNFTTKTREGQFTIRSDNPNGNIADTLRAQMAVVGIPKRFLRDSANYTLSPDGLTLKFRVVDKEAFKQPPSPAFKADGSFSRSTPHVGNPYYTASCEVRLEGSRDTSQATLARLAITVAYQKLLRIGFKNKALLTQAEVRAGLYSNWVEASITGKWGVEDARIITTRQGVLNSDFATTPISDDPGGAAYTPPYRQRGTAAILLEAAAYYDPSIKNAALSVRDLIGPAQLVNNPLVPVGNSTFIANGLQLRPGEAGKTAEA